MNNSEKRAAIIAAAIMLLLFLTSGGIGYFIGSKQCKEAAVISVIRHDTIYRDTLVRLVADIAPQPKKTTPNAKKIAFNAKKTTLDTIPCDTLRIYLKEIVNELPDTLEYCDTFRIAKDYKITYEAKVSGKLIDFRLWHANLKPEITTTITNTVIKKPKPQVYVGAVVGLNNSANKFVAAPSVQVGYRAFLGGYSYDIPNNTHLVGAYWRVFGK